MIVAIAACEIGFWVLLVAGLAARYLLKARALSVALLVSVPLVDVALLVFSVIDLRSGGEASLGHGLAAVYLGVSVAFGHRMLSWADQRFAHRFAGGPPSTPLPAKGTRERASHERRTWFRHVLAYAIAGVILLVFTTIGGDASLWGTFRLWTVVLVIDGLVSLSYSVRRPISSANER